MASTTYNPYLPQTPDFAANARKLYEKSTNFQDLELTRLLEEHSNELRNTVIAEPPTQIVNEVAQETFNSMVYNPIQAPIETQVHEVAQETFNLLPDAVNPPFEIQADAASKIAKDVLKQNNIPIFSIAAALSNLTKAVGLKGLPPLLPPLLWGLYRSEEKHLHNIIIPINTLPERKIYRIALGNAKAELPIVFETAANKPLRFLYEKGVSNFSNSFPRPLFECAGRLETGGVTGIGPFKWKKLVWKRQTHFTNCKIIINDPYNQELQKGPIIYIRPLTKQETVCIIHQDPHALIKEPLGHKIIEGNPSEFKSLDSYTINLANQVANKQRIPLPQYGEEHKTAYLDIEHGIPFRHML